MTCSRRAFLEQGAGVAVAAASLTLWPMSAAWAGTVSVLGDEEQLVLLREIADSYRQQTKDLVAVDFATQAIVERRFLNTAGHASTDVVLVSSGRVIGVLEQAGAIIPNANKIVLSNPVVLGIPADNKTNLQVSPQLMSVFKPGSAIAVPDPSSSSEAADVGALLQRWDASGFGNVPRVVAPTLEATPDLVLGGQAAVCFTLSTTIAAKPALRAGAVVPARQVAPRRVFAALAQRAAPPSPSVLQFFDFLGSAALQKAFAKEGYMNAPQ